MGRILLAVLLLVVFSAGPVVAQSKCRFENGKMICCDPYGWCI